MYKYKLGMSTSRSFGLDTVVLTGNLTAIKAVEEVFEGLESMFGIRFMIPEKSQFATVIGAALCDTDDLEK